MTLPGGGPTVDPQALTVIAAACRDGECVRFAYRGRDGAESRREVEPHSLVNRGRRWYLLAWDRGREDWRTFRVDRLSRARARPACAVPPPRAAGRRTPPRYVAEQHLLGAAALRGAGDAARPAAEARKRVAARAGARSSRSTMRSCEYRTGDYDLDWLALRIAMLGADFEVHEPPELVEHLRALASRLDRAVAAAR